MANPLTGDFEAVLQVSGATVNRLLASMHQNAGMNTATPSFPHSVRMRVGDPRPIDGMRGKVAVQVSVPRIELIHGSTDHFWIEVGIRAQYKADPGTKPVPEFIHGTVRAQYRIDGVDPHCWGWARLAADYIWVRVVADTVSFTGTAVDPIDFASIGSGLDETVARARVTRLITVLLQTNFEATPHKVSRRFQRGSMRSLHVGMNRSVITTPLGLSGEPVAGRVDSINQDLLEGRDFGVGISAAAILARVQSVLDDLKANFNLVVPFYFRIYTDVGSAGDIDWLLIDIHWRVTLKSASAQWSGGAVPLLGTTAGLVTLKVAGQARTQDSDYNLDFDITVPVALTGFDAGTESFTVVPLPAAVDVHGPLVEGTFGSLIEPIAKKKIQNAVQPNLAPYIDQFATALNLSSRKTELITQLKSIDANADAHLDEAVFSNDGVIVRGHVPLSPRRAVVNEFVKYADDNGFSALDSWIPGGRIDAFHWSWVWFNNAGQPGAQDYTDRFVLLRPRTSSRSRFGAFVGLREPLPGLDGSGRVCVSVSGVQVHPVTGEWVPASAVGHCTRYGFDIRLARTTTDRVFLQEWNPYPHDPGGPVEEIGIVEVGGQTESASVNTLVIRAGDEWNGEISEALRHGLAACVRRDAGLRVLVLFRDGALKGGAARFLPQLAELASTLEAELTVNEDVRGSWSKVLFMNDREGELEWRLITPTGGVSWAHTGRLESRELAGALDDYLFPSPPPDVSQVTPPVRIGTRVSAAALEAGLRGIYIDYESPCPSPPISRIGVESAVAFIQKGSAASEVAIRKLMHDHGNDEHPNAFIAVIVDGAALEDIEELQARLHERFMALPDPTGAIAREFGVRVWPTRINVSKRGIVTGVEIGAEGAGPAPNPERAS